MALAAATVAGDAVAVPAVVSGQRPVGFGDPIQVLRERNALVLLGPVQVEGEGGWSHRYLVAATATMTNPRALEGKAVGIAATGTVAELAFRAWAERHGVAAARVQLVAVAPGDMGEALRTGRVAMVDAPSPWAETIAAQGARVLDAQPYAALGNRVITGVWYANRTWLQANREAAADLVAALTRAERWLESNPEQARHLAARAIERPAGALDRNSVLPRLADAGESTLQTLIEAANRLGLLRDLFRPADVLAQLR